MSISPISAASLGQYVLSTGNPAALQQGLQTLQESLASGDLNTATAALQSVETFFKTRRRPAARAFLRSFLRIWPLLAPR